MYTTDNVINAMDVAANPEAGGIALRWAEEVIAWAEESMTDFERERVLEVHRARWS